MCNTVKLVQNDFPVATGYVVYFNTIYDVTLSTTGDKEGRRAAEMVLFKENENQVVDG